MKLSLRPATSLNAVENEMFLQIIAECVPSQIVDMEISLLEEFDYQQKRHTQAGYCDYEVAYVSYRLAYSLFNHTVNSSLLAVMKKAILPSVKTALSNKKPNYESIRQIISTNSSHLVAACSQSGLDPLLDRLSKLKSGKPTHGHTPASNLSLDSLVAKEVITVDQLTGLLHDTALKILLVDFRSPIDHNGGHIKFSESVNCPPLVVSQVLTASEKATDYDLEVALRPYLSRDEFDRFQQRYKYDLIVCYDLDFGLANGAGDPFAEYILHSPQSLAHNNPFQKFASIIMYSNQYLSSRLKRLPCYLAGGLAAWRLKFGETGVEKTPAGTKINGNIHAPSSQANPKEHGIDSRYVKSFDGYMASAKRPSPPPLSTDAKKMPLAPLTPHFTGSSSGTDFSKSQPNHSNAIQRDGMANLGGDDTSRHLSPPSKAQKGNGNTGTGQSSTLVLDRHITGLVNLGNSCYMNCIVQCLAATPQLTSFLFSPSTGLGGKAGWEESYRQHINMDNKLGSKGILTASFAKLLRAMIRNTSPSFSPTEFKQIIGSISPGKQFASYDQQDCNEFLNFMLDGLHEDLNQRRIADAHETKAIVELTEEEEKVRETLPIRLASTVEWERYLKLNFSVIVDYFQGQYSSHLKCLECGLTSTTYNAFTTLSLPIPEKLSLSKLGSDVVLLQDCLDEFTTTELLDIDNRWHCPRCRQFTKLTKTISITRLPQVLIIHFKRFKISGAGNFNKLETLVSYPVDKVLDLTTYQPQFGSYFNKNSASPLMSIEQETQLVNVFPVRSQTGPFQYKLYAVANHFGNLTTGHYTSHVYKSSDAGNKRGWCYFNDSKVTLNVDPKDVLNRNAYCLFYQRI